MTGDAKPAAMPQCGYATLGGRESGMKKPERTESILCGDCFLKITAPVLGLRIAYEKHKASGGCKPLRPGAKR